MEEKKEKPPIEFALLPLPVVRQIRAYLGAKPLPYDETAGMIQQLELARVVSPTEQPQLPAQPPSDE